MAMSTFVGLLLCVVGFTLGAMPNITLPWGTYTASLHDSNRNLYTFTNVRFGKAPTGSLRFMQSQYPDNVTDPATVFPVESSARCPQVSFANCPFYQPPACAPEPLPGKPQDEDCLTLDIYVPGKAIDNHSAKLPVVVWLFGGAFIFGARDNANDGPFNAPFYNGTAYTSQKHQDLIFVVGNYRLGAYGWLGGRTMQEQGYPNAGLSDQRLTFQFVHDFIGLVGGDESQVSAWGESAGAGSIVHHLISAPSYKPLFQKAALQSPAFELHWNQDTGEKTFQQFAEAAGVPSAPYATVEDLQKVDAETLAKANNKLACDTTAATGLFPLGPGIDGTVVRDLPPVALENGNFHKLESILVSHVKEEAADFVPKAFKPENNPTDATLIQFLKSYFQEPSLEGLITNITEQYPLAKYKGDQQVRVKNIIQDSMFTCNTRYLFDAYHSTMPDKTFMMEWTLGADFNAAKHATDLPALFWNSNWKVVKFLQSASKCFPLAKAAVVSALWALRAPIYQSYFTSFARCGNPNTCPSHKGIIKKWPAATLDKTGNKVANTLDFGGTSNSIITDNINTWDACGFWKDAAETLQKSKEAQILKPGARSTEQQILVDEL